LYIHVANWDIRRAIVTGQEEQLLRYVDRAFEKTTKFIRELGEKYKNVTQADLIVNVAGYNLVQHGCSRCERNYQFVPCTRLCNIICYYWVSLSMQLVGIPVILRALISYENHYPGYADKIFLINSKSLQERTCLILFIRQAHVRPNVLITSTAPSTFEPLMQAVRGVLNEVTDEALKIFGTNKKEWLNALLEVIDEDQLSISLGGKKVWEGVDDDA